MMESSVLVYILLTIVTVGLGFCVKNTGLAQNNQLYLQRGQAKNTIAQVAIFCLLTGVSACRIAVGNDYWVYRDNFKLIAQNRHVSSEFGFNYIVKWLQQLFGYDNYLPVFGFFSILTVFFFTKALKDQATRYAFTLFLLLTNGYYFNSLNSVRYYLALAIALYSMKYVIKGEYLKFLWWIAVGGILHKSIFVVIPLYMAADYLAHTKLKKWHYALGAALVASLIFGQDIYRAIIFKIYPFYENSAFDDGQLSYVNIAKCLGTLLLCIICYQKSIKNNPRLRFYFMLNLGALFLYSFGSFIPEVSRIGYYMTIVQIFLIPELIGEMDTKWLQKLCKVGVIVAFSIYFVLLLKSFYRVDIRLLPYLNWIFN